jgi:hypothetical protein
MKWRPPTAFEAAILGKLLSADFPGRPELLAQVSAALVRQIDRDGSLEFDAESSAAASVKRRIPIEAQAKDLDGIWIHDLLHVVGGRVKELEFYKDDSSKILQMPPLERWELMKLE